ncbi:hypothetical protein CAEBREN_22393 [Caenorhabditis brenneri]|uniref:Uncharacterized protein n=1 Tax=Caenorhabditis brenneri TaxID=135651 RepID=G0NTM2_CAEBE|nr:hypothetical protein CAEBREN_22393 [Caenorhabditis brenneri]
MIFFYLVLFISSLLYLPIFLSTRRQRHLVSIAKNRPDRYILFQTCFIIISKIIQIYMSTFSMDITCTVVLIQVSYLLCNKRNKEKLKTLISIKRLFRWIFCRKDSRVQPAVPNIYETVNTTVY